MGRGRIAAAIVALYLGGCASTTMQHYVGHDLDRVVAKYGYPDTQFPYLNGMTAFQWVISASSDPAAQAPLTAFRPVSTVPMTKRGAANARGLLMGGMCTYTIYARWDAATSKWRVAGYRRPRLDCA